jgi:phage terminase large subunit
MFKWTQKQKEALKTIIEYDKKTPLYFLLYGGSQSAKTSFACAYIQTASIKYPKTTSIICRHNFTDLKATIFQNTFPNILSLKLGEELASNRAFIKYNYSPPLSAEFYNGSRIYFIGLEDNSNFEKILGRQASMFLIDEASEVGYSAFSKLTTRMSEKSDARKLGFVTMNPTSVFSWTYKLFIEKLNPIDDKPLKNFQFFKNLQMNPKDNLDNLPDGYLDNLENLSEHDRERFLFGNFLTTAEGAVYEEQLNRCKEEERIRDVGNIDSNYPLYISLDIGWDDFNSAWVFQILPTEIKFYLYFEENKIDIVGFLVKIKEKIKIMKGNKWQEDTTVILPHDASHHWVGTGMSLKQVLTLHSANSMGMPVTYKILRLMGIYEGINACRLMFAKVSFDKVGCDIGVRRLGQYKEYIVDGNDEFTKKTKHDMASHAADSFRYAITSFYFQKPFQEDFRRDPNAIYGYDILNKRTRANMGL